MLTKTLFATLNTTPSAPFADPFGRIAPITGYLEFIDCVLHEGATVAYQCLKNFVVQKVRFQGVAFEHSQVSDHS